MKLFKFIFTPAPLLMVIMAFLLPALPGQAQEQEWEALIYDYADNRFVSITAAGVASSISIPEVQPASVYGIIEISPNRRYAAIADTPASLKIVDLNAGSCCVSVSNPLSGGELEAYTSVVFSPDSSRLAVGYAGRGGTMGTGVDVTGGIAIIDVTSGAILEQTTSASFEYATGFPVSWDTSGILFYESCWGCEGTFAGFYKLWQPGTTIISDTSFYFDMFYGDSLPGTGEFLYSGYHPDFPFGGEAGMLPEGNVVQYFAAGTYPISLQGSSTPSPSQIVYFDAEKASVPRARWVINGKAFWLHRSDAIVGVLVFRDGSQQTVPVSAGQVFIVGTPDGWLSFDESAGAIYHYRYNAGSLTPSPVAQVTGPVKIIEATQPGYGETLPPFTVNVVPPPPTVCPGFMASRLKINFSGRVTPGPSNRVRSGPGLSYSMVGEIPGGEYFYVLEGPVCADEMAWWRVAYGEIEGWTSEGQGDTYWLEPVP